MEKCSAVLALHPAHSDELVTLASVLSMVSKRVGFTGARQGDWRGW